MIVGNNSYEAIR